MWTSMFQDLVARLFLGFTLVLGQDLAVVRPYASLSEITSLESSFLPGLPAAKGCCQAKPGGVKAFLGDDVLF